MFIGHFAVGFGAKKLAPQVSLGTLLLAAQFIDLLWPTLLLLGVEQVRITPGNVPPLEFVYYPISHSLLLVCVWAGVFGGVYFALKHNQRAAVVLGLLVLSHWVLDLFVHYPDLPLYPGAKQLLGLQGWAYPMLELLIELMLFIGGVAVYLRSTRARDALGHWTLWSLVACLILIHISNFFGPPPPSVSAIAWVGQVQWLLVLWGYWIDRHRRTLP